MAETAESFNGSPIQDYLNNLHARLLNQRDGTVATYIPELAKADPDWFGICIATTDGHIYEVGDTRRGFTIQSISKPFAYGLALEDNGLNAMMEKVWVEPSGEAFNAISLRPQTGQPSNPMINAGAIATTSMVKGKTASEKIGRILETFSRFAGHDLLIDQETYRSESETGHRNRAIGYMLRNFDIITEDPTVSLEAYFQQCSIEITGRDLAMMAATLANGGINPETKVRAVKGEYVEHIISVMASCGMYDGAGEWIYNVGMPAKSGVAGGIMTVLPGQFGISVFSPPLDERGNSVRGIEVCREISREFNLHMFHEPGSVKTVIRRTFHVGAVSSNRLRSAEESALLHEHGKKLKVFELQGKMIFSSTEMVVREVMARVENVEMFILDFTHVQGADVSAPHFLHQLANLLISRGKRVAFTRTRHLGPLLQSLKEKVKDVDWIEDNDLALEGYENRLIERYGTRRSSLLRMELSECELLQGLAAAEVAHLERLMTPCTFSAEAVIIEEGAASADLYFLLRGKVSVWIKLANGGEKRVATFSPGMTFGEMALIDRSPRSAMVRADQEVECLALAVDSFEQVSAEHSRLPAILTRNLALILSRRLRKSNLQASILNL